MVIPLDAVIQSGGLRQAIFRAPFLAPSPRGVSRVDPKEGCSVVGAAAEGLFLPHSKSQRLSLTLTANVPVYD